MHKDLQAAPGARRTSSCDRTHYSNLALKLSFQVVQINLQRRAHAHFHLITSPVSHAWSCSAKVCTGESTAYAVRPSSAVSHLLLSTSRCSPADTLRGHADAMHVLSD